MKKNLLHELLLEMGYQSEDMDIDEQTPLAVSDALRATTAATKEFDLIPKLATLFKTSEASIALALKKDMTVLNNELKLAIGKDFKNGVRVSTSNALGNAAKEASKMKASKEIMESKSLLSEADVLAIIERTKNESKAYAKQIEAGKIKPPTGTGGGTAPVTPPVVPPGSAKTKYMKSLIKRVSLKGLGWGAAAVTVAGLAYLILNRAPTESETPYIQEIADKLNGAPKCIYKLARKYNIESPAMDDNGDLYLHIPNYEGVDGGIIVYLNDSYVVKEIKTGKTGKWSCGASGENMTVQENKVLSLMNIIFEQQQPTSNAISEEGMDQIVRDMIDLLDFPVTQQNLIDAESKLNSIIGKTVNGTPAGQYFLDLYKRSGLGGGDIKKTLKYIYANDPKSVRYLQKLNQLVTQLEGDSGSGNTPGGDDEFNIIWDGGDDGGDGQPVQPVPEQKIKYRLCETGPYTLGCYNKDVISQVQRCIGAVSGRAPRGDGYFGPITQSKLAEIGLTNGFTDADVDRICSLRPGDKLTPGEAPTNPPDATNKPIEPIAGNIPQQPLDTSTIETPRQTYERYFKDNKFDSRQKNRIKLKVHELSNKDLNNLNEYFKTQGYYKLKNPEKKYGVKYVWKQK